MIRAVFSILISLITFFSFVQPASAHVLLTSGSIGATVHVDPDDDPIIGIPTNFYFEFKDKENKFNPSDCDCKISIYKNGTELSTQDLFTTSDSNNINSPIFQFTFPEKNIYELKITGTPKTSNSFKAFELNHTLRITREQNPSEQATINTSDIHFFHYLTAAIAVAVFVIILLLDRRGRNKKTPKKPQKIITLILGFSLLSPLIYATVHFSADHLIIGSHENHPCCFTASPETTDSNTITISQNIYPTFNNLLPEPISIDFYLNFTSRAPPTS